MKLRRISLLFFLIPIIFYMIFESGICRYQEYVQEVEPIDCTPGMLCHPMAALRWFQLIQITAPRKVQKINNYVLKLGSELKYATHLKLFQILKLMFFILQWLVQITCGNDACTMIMNVFGYVAMGQLFVLLILLFMSFLIVPILIGYGLNGHRAFSGVMLAMERFYAAIGILLFLVAGILGTWMAVQTNDPEVNYQGRGSGHIKPQWIAAAVIEFLMVFVYVFDLLLQRREGYPFTGKNEKRQLTPESEYTFGEQTIY